MVGLRTNMLEKRIIVCLDVRDGRTTKGVKFKDNRDIGDPVEMADHYAKGRVISILEGGYSLKCLPELAGNHVEILLNACSRRYR